MKAETKRASGVGTARARLLRPHLVDLQNRAEEWQTSSLLLPKAIILQGQVARACNPCTREIEAEGSL